MPDHSTQSIVPLKMVELSFKAAAREGDNRDKFSTASFRFIYGIGVDGVTPFEKALYGKSSGDTIHLEIESGQVSSLFGHLAKSACEAIGFSPPFSLYVSVRAVHTADQREVVKAMAQISACGSDCDCGCGC